MKKRKIILSILLGLIIVLSILFINFKSHKTYRFKLPIESKVVSVSLEQNAKNKLLGDSKEIKKFYEVLKNNYKTKIKSSNHKKEDGKIKIVFYYEDAISTIIYLYKLNDEYYLEQVNNGVYQIDEKKYNDVANYIKNL